MKLPLAIDIADRVTDAATNNIALDISSEADTLLARHPEADVSVMEIAATIEEELGVERPNV